MDWAALDKKIVAKDPKSIDSRIRLAEYLFAKNEFDAAFLIYKDLAVLTPVIRQVFSRLVESRKKKEKMGRCAHLSETIYRH